MLAAVAVRCFSYNFAEIVPAAATSFWSTRATTVSVACAIMLACLPAAFAIRRNIRNQQSTFATKSQWQWLLAHPEQPFFFVPYGLIATLIAFELRTGMITIGWIALGLTAFLAALPIGERSYRLAGLGASSLWPCEDRPGGHLEPLHHRPYPDPNRHRRSAVACIVSLLPLPRDDPQIPVTQHRCYASPIAEDPLFLTKAGRPGTSLLSGSLNLSVSPTPESNARGL